ncbi:MAG: hypothetical protein EA409_12425 [Saprospirales bacterium]|nr:MAG: hypothetical protein EA409_12425 [Saprospirales bacterium]
MLSFNAELWKCRRVSFPASSSNNFWNVKSVFWGGCFCKHFHVGAIGWVEFNYPKQERGIPNFRIPLSNNCR